MFSPNKVPAKKYMHSQALIHEQDLFLESLQKKLEDKNVDNFYTLTSLNIPQRPGPDKKQYARDLLNQIEEKKKKVQLENQVNYKAVYSEFCFEPTHTPEHLKKDQKNQFKNELESQISAKTSQLKSEKALKLEAEKQENMNLLKKIAEDEELRAFKNSIEKKLLTESWKIASKTKQVQEKIDNMENNGINPRSISAFYKESSINHSNILLNERDEGTSNQKRSDSSKRDNYIKKSLFLKNQIEEKDRKHLKYKIRKIIQDVKAKRNANSSSLSPAGFNSRSYYEKRKRL